MKMYLGLTKRNMLVYFKDRQAILFSLLTSVIVFVLYLLFLRNTFVDAINQALAEMPMVRELVMDDDLNMFTDIKLLVGILGSAAITVPFSCLRTVTSDRETRVDQDILATPVSRSQIVLAYFTASALSAIVMTSVILTAGLVILQLQGKLYLGLSGVLGAYGVTALGCVSSTALFMNIVLFFRSGSASAAFFGILSAVSGFVIGAYIPVSQFSGGVRTVCNLFPASHITILLRNVLLGGVLGHIDNGIGGLDQGKFVQVLKDVFTFKADMFGSSLNTTAMLSFVLAILTLSLIVMVYTYSKNYKKK